MVIEVNRLNHDQATTFNIKSKTCYGLFEAENISIESQVRINNDLVLVFQENVNKIKKRQSPNCIRVFVCVHYHLNTSRRDTML